jgi:hypothetical protein
LEQQCWELITITIITNSILDRIFPEKPAKNTKISPLIIEEIEQEEKKKGKPPLISPKNTEVRPLITKEIENNK